MNADGSNVTRLTHNPGSDAYPTWSPDGTKITWASRKHGGNDEIYVMNADGSNQTRLTDGLENRHPDWSPDGRKIVFTSNRGACLINRHP